MDYDVGGRVVKQRWTVWPAGASSDTRALRCTDGDRGRNLHGSDGIRRPEGRVRGRLYSNGIAIDVVGLVGGNGSRSPYDGAGRLKSIPDLIPSITYNAAGRPLGTTYANQVKATNSYDLASAVADRHRCEIGDLASLRRQLHVQPCEGLIYDGQGLDQHRGRGVDLRL